MTETRIAVMWPWKAEVYDRETCNVRVADSGLIVITEYTDDGDERNVLVHLPGSGPTSVAYDYGDGFPVAIERQLALFASPY